MLGLPKSTEISKQLPKKAIYSKFELKAVQREHFDADISRIDIVNIVSSKTVPGLKEGEYVKEFYVLLVSLKQEDYDEKNILLLSKLINQHIVFALIYRDRVRLAVVHEKLFVKDWEPLPDAVLPLKGYDIDSVWENLVTVIGSFEVTDGKTVGEQISYNTEKQKLIKKLETLKKRLNKEKQPRKQYDLYTEIQELELKIKQF